MENARRRGATRRGGGGGQGQGGGRGQHRALRANHPQLFPCRTRPLPHPAHVPQRREPHLPPRGMSD